MATEANDTFLLEKQEFSDEDSDGMEYADVSEDDSLLASSSDEEDGLEGAGVTLASLTRRDAGVKVAELESKAVEDGPKTSVRPSVVDDFFRNFLIRLGFNKTLDIFNTEWYEPQHNTTILRAVAPFLPVSCASFILWFLLSSLFRTFSLISS